MENKKIRVAITHGDTNGIGYEIIFKAFSESNMFDLCTPIIYGSPRVAMFHRKALDMPVNFNTDMMLLMCRTGNLIWFHVLTKK